MASGMYSVETLLSREYIEDRLLKIDKPAVIGEYLMPKKYVGSPKFNYFGTDTKGHMTPEVPRNAEGPIMKIRFEQFQDTVVSYKESIEFDDRIKDGFLLFDVIGESTEELFDAAALRKESLIIDTIMNNYNSGAAFEEHFWIDLDADDNAGRNWVDGTANVNIVADLEKARYKIREVSNIVPDTVVCGPEVMSAVKLLHPQMWAESAQLGQNMILEGRFPGVGALEVGAFEGHMYGYDWFVSSAVKLADNDDMTSALSLILENDVIVCKRGKIGNNYTLTDNTVLTGTNERTHHLWTQLEFECRPILRRADLVYVILNAKSTL